MLLSSITVVDKCNTIEHIQLALPGETMQLNTNRATVGYNPYEGMTSHDSSVVHVS